MDRQHYSLGNDLIPSELNDMYANAVSAMLEYPRLMNVRGHNLHIAEQVLIFLPR